ATSGFYYLAYESTLWDLGSYYRSLGGEWMMWEAGIWTAPESPPPPADPGDPGDPGDLGDPGDPPPDPMTGGPWFPLATSGGGEEDELLGLVDGVFAPGAGLGLSFGAPLDLKADLPM